MREVRLPQPVEGDAQRVLLGQDWMFDRPRHADCRIVPRQPPVVLRVEELAALVVELRLLGQDAESVREPGGDVELPPVLRAQLAGVPPPERGRAPADVHRDVPHRPPHHRDELRLRTVQLVVEATHDVLHGEGPVVLHEDVPDAVLEVPLRVVRLGKPPPGVAVDVRGDHLQARDRTRLELRSHVRPLPVQRPSTLR